MRNRSVLTSLIVLVTILHTAGMAETLIPALGARSAGRGGANFAFDDNGYILHDNPAGLIGATTLDCGCRGDLVEVSIAGLFPDLEYSDPQNRGINARNDPFGMGAFTFGRAVLDDVAIGLGVYTPAGFGAKWNLEGPPGPLAGPQLYKSLGMLIRVLPGVSYQATERLRVGATLGVAISHVELEGPHFIESQPFRGTPTMVDIQTTGAALTWSTGFQFRATEAWTIAGRYQSQNRFENQGNARVSIPLLGTSFYDSSMSIIWPRSVGVGLQYQSNPTRRYGLDVDWQQWSSAMETIDLTFRDPSNPVFQAVAGPVLRDSLPLDWKDTVVVKVGVEQDLAHAQTIRLGYSHNSDAVRGRTTTPYLPTILSHYFTAGYGWNKSGWEYDVAYQFAFRPTMHVGNSDFVGGDHSQSSLSTQTHWLFAGMTRRF